MTKKTIKEVEDNIESTLYQGKPLSQWEKEFKGEFTARQLFQLIRSGVDLGRIKLGLVDEANSIDDKALFKDEEFFFNEKDNEQQMNEVTDEEAALDESSRNPEDVVTVEDFIELLRSRTNLDDKLMFRTYKKEALLFDVNSKAGITIVDIVPSADAKRISESEDDNPYTVADLIDELEDSTTSPNSDLVFVDVKGNPYYITKVVAQKNTILLKCSEVNSMNEGRSWYGGGYGGTGKSYKSLGSRAPRGAEIGWYPVDQLDPKAAGKMPGWRCGPSNFPFEDLLYPERKYVKGVMVMRNKYIKAGSMSGDKYIAIPSYFDCIKNNDQEAINLLKALGIPLDLTFGMDPNEDYSNSYTIKK